MHRRWIGVDFDGTLATFDKGGWPRDYRHVGKPVPAMVKRVIKWLDQGEDVRIFTARMDCYHPNSGRIPAHLVRRPIEAWCRKHLGRVLPITNRKDYWCKRIYDDRARQVEMDTGRLL
jgi:hypothetical protein